MSSPKETVYQALKASYDLHESLGADGQQATEQNQFGDVAMVADIGAERVMIQKLQEQNVYALVHSEEHGELTINGDGLRRLVVMDGLDGSSVYKRARGTELYGTMLALFENDNPVYEDYLATGIALHSLHQAVIAVKGQGISVIDLQTDEPIYDYAPIVQSLADGRIFVDDSLPDESAALYPYFKTNHDVFGEPLRAANLRPEHTGSSASYYALLALGKASMVGEATRKGNLEFATAYAIVHEAGGTMTDVMTGSSLGEHKFLEFGQHEHRPILTAANHDIELEAQEIIRTDVPILEQK